MHNMTLESFHEVNLNDPFFDSLKADYPDFAGWFDRKAGQGEQAFVGYDRHGNLQAFLYTKIEGGAIEDVVPSMPDKRYLKVGTLKVDAHGTKLGEYCIKRIMDQARLHRVDEIYVTVFPKHGSLCALLARYGFVKVATKGGEDVLCRPLFNNTGDVVKDYPVIRPAGRKIFLLGIQPQFHSRLFAESILNNERLEMLEDVSYTNSIHKAYVCYMRSMSQGMFQAGDVLVIYRTTDIPGRARFRSVATSVCVVEEMRSKGQFSDIGNYMRFCGPYTVFTDQELSGCWRNSNLHVIKMLYNVALNKRIIMDDLIKKVGVPEDGDGYWGLVELSEAQLRTILQLGEVDESTLVD